MWIIWRRELAASSTMDLTFFINKIHATLSGVYNPTCARTHICVRYKLNTGKHEKRALPSMAHRDCERKANQEFKVCNESERDAYLYNLPHNFVDFALDENGLWVVYVHEHDNTLIVSKLEVDV
jgi:hypothetical protein